MFDKTYYATHPDMMECVSNEELRDRYLIDGLFRDGEVRAELHPCRAIRHRRRRGNNRLCQTARRKTEPARLRATRFSNGANWRSSMSASVEATVTVDGESFALGNKDCLYVTMGAKDVQFSGDGARFYLASCPAHKAFTTRKLSHRRRQCA